MHVAEGSIIHIARGADAPSLNKHSNAYDGGPWDDSSSIIRIAQDADATFLNKHINAFGGQCHPRGADIATISVSI
jgi:hypothetical protein